VRSCCEKAWLACAIDSEGSIQVWRQSSKNMKTRAFGMRVMIYNACPLYVARCVEILESLGIEAVTTHRMTSRTGNKLVTTVKVQRAEDVARILEQVAPFMTTKRAAALAVHGLAKFRVSSRKAHGQRTPWTDEQIELAELIRAEYMPVSERANGETPPSHDATRAIPCQAEGSAESTSEGVETRDASSTCSNRPHECPAAPSGVEDIVRSSRKLESRDKELGEDIARA
jgi:nucleoid DNA-binding protein